MDTEPTFRAAFWILFAGVLVMRVYFVLQVRRAGERVMPDQQAIEHEGRWMYAARVVAFVVLLAWLVLYGIAPAWIEALSVPFPGWLRWWGLPWESPAWRFGGGLKLCWARSGRLSSSCASNITW